ncbi:DUF3127 domain-containing protein [Rhodocytophaga aerolata]|uniref:DUF3127 domain-containing protein n=1 Tax=Rhodocytophaga aerolata TaxID=455078 RepID=A0ABT8R5D7_9BACT|nr:DUF3127 domain-containing protein [Rhodocytophaga aerolata]MDO1447316.1 DUF3127 domain-containing protein [Rhodocytophaga aerolata]
MSFELTGRVVEITPTQQVSDKFRKREFVVEFAENTQYPEFVKLELVQDKCDLLDKFAVGQEVEVMFNLKGRRWTDAKGEVKYFNSLQAWKINAAGSKATAPNSPAPAKAEAGQPARPYTDWAPNGEGNLDDDLPF